MIIHISGASGTGKTTLGKKLSNYFGKTVIVKDLDSLIKNYIDKTEKTDISSDEFVKNFNKIIRKKQ